MHQNMRSGGKQRSTKRLQKEKNDDSVGPSCRWLPHVPIYGDGVMRTSITTTIGERCLDLSTHRLSPPEESYGELQ
ncbi:fuculose phosphate aldolase [Anopheles sinensis]|uniref:Fuculose phosphate aldolase n=1 Tax=Anopheles sinensis TaxID=74873 RepID=A0A084VXA5_ANOSI|nr:fuculose phosphate aldolase [Anopheles sinensis]